MKYSLDQVLTFVEVAETGSFSRAAEKMGLSKAIVSQRISTLEKHIKIQLFNRSTRRVMLTEAGKLYLDGVQPVFRQIENATNAVRHQHQIAEGNLRVIMPAPFVRTTAGRFIPNFSKKYPNINLELIVVEHPIAHINNDHDIIIYPHVNQESLPDLTCVAKKILSVPAGIYATPAYLQQHGYPQEPKDLLKHNCSAVFSGPWPFKRKTGPVFFIEPSGNISTNHENYLRSIVLNGVGIGYAHPRLFYQEIHDKDVIPLLTDYLYVEADIYALYPKRHSTPYKLTVFLQELQEFLDKEQEIIRGALRLHSPENS